MRIAPTVRRTGTLGSCWASFFILLIYFSVSFVIDGIIRLFARLEIVRILISDDSDGLCAVFKMLMFDDACVGNFAFGIIHHRIALEVFRVQQLMVETQASVLQTAATEIKITRRYIR